MIPTLPRSVRREQLTSYGISSHAMHEGHCTRTVGISMTKIVALWETHNEKIVPCGSRIQKMGDARRPYRDARARSGAQNPMPGPAGPSDPPSDAGPVTSTNARRDTQLTRQDWSQHATIGRPIVRRQTIIARRADPGPGAIGAVVEGMAETHNAGPRGPRGLPLMRGARRSNVCSVTRICEGQRPLTLVPI